MGINKQIEIQAIDLKQHNYAFVNERFVVNAFMHSAWVMVLRRCVEWENVDSFRRERIYPFRSPYCFNIGWINGKTPIIRSPNTIQRTAVIIEPFGTDKSVPYANTGKCTIQRTAQKSLPIGMHKCIPYENSVNAPYAA